jgi:hypothetical protein
MTPLNSDRIAICGEWFPSSLKQRLLFFDRIGVFYPEWLVALQRKRAKEGFSSPWERHLAWGKDVLIDFANDLEFLQNENIVFDAMPFFLRFVKSHARISPDGSLETVQDMLSAIHLELDFRDDYRTFNKRNMSEVDALGLKLEGARQYQGRVCARHMQNVEGLTASLLLSEPLVIPEIWQDG